MKKYDYFLFDWDGTVAQTLDIWLECLKIPLQKQRHSFTDKEIGADFTLFKEFAISQRIADIDAIIATATELAALKTPDVPLYPGVQRLLEKLKKDGKKVAIVTTSLHAQIDSLVKKHELETLIDAIVCGDDVANIKPHPEPLHLALSLLGGSPKQAVMIGDSDKDIEAAQRAGMDSILVYPDRHRVFYNLDSLQALCPTHQIINLEDICTLQGYS